MNKEKVLDLLSKIYDILDVNKVPVLYTMAKEKFNAVDRSSFILLLMKKQEMFSKKSQV